MSILQNIYDIISAHYLNYRLNHITRNINELKSECTDPDWIKRMEEYIRLQQRYIEGALLLLHNDFTDDPRGFRIASQDAGYKVAYYGNTENLDTAGIEKAFVSFIPISKRCYDDVVTGFTLRIKLPHKLHRADVEKFSGANEENRLENALCDACFNKDIIIEEVVFLEVGPGSSVMPTWALTRDVLSKIPDKPGESSRTCYKLKDPDLSSIHDNHDLLESLEPYGKLDELHAELSSFVFNIRHGIAKLKLTEQRTKRDRLKRLYNLP